MSITLAQFIPDVAMAAGPEVIAFTEDNEIALAAWAWAEDSEARWNPWDTTLYIKGATAYNTFGEDEHVWSYATKEGGIFAFLATLHQATLGDYGPIRAALAAGDTPHALAVAVHHSGWGTETFLSIVTEALANPEHYLGRIVAGS